MNIDLAELKPLQIYGLMTQTIIPRPIAWVLSESENQELNLAPFSYFNAVCSAPPLIMLSMGWKDRETEKDTAVNIRARKDFVIHIPSRDELIPMNDSSATLPHGESELAQHGLETVPFEGSRLPRLKDSRVAMACTYYDLHELGPGRQALILGEVKRIYVEDTCIEQIEGRFHVDAKGVDPVARLGPKEYATLADVIEIARPK